MISKETGDVHIKSKKAGTIFSAIFCIVVGIIAILSVIMSIILK